MKRITFSVLLGAGLVWSASAASLQEEVDALIPRLASANVSERHAPQLQIQALAANASRPGAETERGELSKLLASRITDANVPLPARVWLVRQLEYIGAVESVPALSTLLTSSDEELRECARRALEKNAAPAAVESLRAALQKQGGSGAFAIGLIHSLGERRDARSAALITKSLSQPAAAPAAAQALGRIASEEAIRSLWAFYERNAAVAAEGLLAGANELTARGQKAAAREICKKLFESCSEPAIRPAALVIMADADTKLALEWIKTALAGPDHRLHVAAITAGRQVYGTDAAASFAKLLPQVSAPAKVLVLRELDSSAEKLVLGLITDADEPVRLAALETLGRIGGGGSVPALVKAAANSPVPGKQIATQSLTRMSGPGADAALVKLAGQAEPTLRASAITALGDRGYQEALPALLKYAAETDQLVCAAACNSLGKLGADAEVEPVAKLALAGVPPAETALESLLTRVSDKNAAGARLLELAKTAAPAQLPIVFSALSVLGGANALQALTDYAHNANAQVQDAAVRAIAGWNEFSAMDTLLKLAADPAAKRVHNVLALQGAARLIRSADGEPAAARVDAALKAMAAAQRDDEKRLLVTSLGSVQNRAAADALKKLMSEDALKESAGQAALTLAGGLQRGDRKTARDLVAAVKEANISPALNSKADEMLKR